MLSLIRTPLKYFMFIYLTIFIVQRKNVAEFNYKQTAIQSGILMVFFVFVNSTMDWYFQENFELHAHSEPLPIIPSVFREPEDIVGHDVTDPQSDPDDFNKEFELRLTKPDVPAFDNCSNPPVTPQVTKQSQLIKNEHYNTHSGYTYMDPSTFRVGQQTQPPICLTDRPCETQSALVDTSMGREFLPYAFIKSNTQIREDKRVRNKCKASMVYNA